MEPGSPQMPRSSPPRSGTTGKPRLSTIRICPTGDHPHTSMTPITPTRKNAGEPVSAFSAGNMKLPLGMRDWFTPPRGSLSAELLGKTLSRVHSVPNPLSNVPSRSTGKGRKGSVTLKNPSPEAAAAFPLATEMSSFCTNTTLAKPFPLHPLSLKSPMESEKLRVLPSSPGQTTLPRKELEDVTKPQEHPGQSANMSSQVSRDFHFAKLVMKYSPTTQTHHGELPHARAVEQLEPTVKKGESDQHSGGTKMFHLAEASSIVPTVPSASSARPSTWQVASDFRSASTALYDAEESTGPQRWFYASPRHSIPLLAPGPALEDSSLLPVAGEAALLQTRHGGLNRLQLKIRGTSEAVLFSPSANKVELLESRRGESTTSRFYPEPASLKRELLERPKLLDVGWAWKVGSSLPSSLSSSSSSLPSVLSVITPAPTFPLTMSAGLAGGPVRGVLPLGSSEKSLQSHVQPTSGNLSDLSTMSADGDATSSPGKFHQSLLYTVDEQVAVTASPTGDGEEAGEEEEDEEEQDAAVALLPWDSDSNLLDWRAHARRSLRSDDEPFKGYATLSDDTCGSGNYSMEISLQPAAAGSPASPPDSFLARMVLQEKSSRLALSIRSCCVTPSVQPAALDRSACCFFPRSVAECRHIQVHQNSRSQAASFTIRLFQMLNLSVVYLHCELSVCPKEHAGCGQVRGIRRPNLDLASVQPSDHYVALDAFLTQLLKIWIWGFCFYCKELAETRRH
ncbi:Uromodulin-like 1 [Varanus komodoensis]|nr:Uromodulin-like 1 [Varanus komodoensis]